MVRYQQSLASSRDSGLATSDQDQGPSRQPYQRPHLEVRPLRVPAPQPEVGRSRSITRREAFGASISDRDRRPGNQEVRDPRATGRGHGAPRGPRTPSPPILRMTISRERRAVDEAQNLIDELERAERIERREMATARRNHQRMRVIDPETNRPRAPPRGREGQIIGDHGPFVELAYQVSSLTSELRNLRDQMSALTNAVHSNSDYLENVISSNEEILGEIKN